MTLSMIERSSLVRCDKSGPVESEFDDDTEELAVGRAVAPKARWEGVLDVTGPEP
jgi:hypothetical protein